MKRTLLWLLVLLAAVGAHAEESLFMPGEAHRSHLDFRQYFETMSAQAGECTISIAEAAYEPALAQQLYEQIAADEAVLAGMAQPQPHTVYVVDRLFDGMQRIGAAIYCTAEEVLSGAYRPWLTETAFGVEKWRGIGLAGYAFGEATDDAALTEWYADDVHDDMLSLFHAYFVPEFAGEDELHMAEQTAVSLMRYMIGQDGLQAAVTEAPSGYVQGWLGTLGIDRPYADAYEGLLDGYAYTRNQFYAMIATSPKGDVFKLNPLSRDMSTPAQVRMTLCELELAVDAILAGVKRDAPDYYPVLLKNYEAPITYEFAEADGYSVTYHSNRRIACGSAASVIHETAHMMAPCVIDRISRYVGRWKVEAIAEYLMLTYYPGRMEKERLWGYMQDDGIQAFEDPEGRAFAERIREIYLEYAPFPAQPEQINAKLWWRADVAAAQELEVAYYSISDVYVEAGSASLEAMNGNELSYVEAEWLASYLINRHGLSAFLHYCLDEGVAFEDAYAMSYEEAKAEWLANRSMLE